jgi:hypothetical protein
MEKKNIREPAQKKTNHIRGPKKLGKKLEYTVYHFSNIFHLYCAENGNGDGDMSAEEHS